MSKNWSVQQQAIFSWVQDGEGNAIVDAVAGSGKTTTIIECSKRIPAGSSYVFLAFNRSIVEELTAKGIEARTFHSIGFGPTIKAINGDKKATSKTYKIASNILGEDDMKAYGQAIIKLVSLAKSNGIGCIQPDEYTFWRNIAEYHNVADDIVGDGSISEVIRYSQKVLQLSNASKAFDFDDMLYIPLMRNLSLPKFDFIFVDEAQDTNVMRRAFIRKMCKPHTRIIAVGDAAQSIYGFTGADNDSLNIIAQEFNCQRFPLSTTYRCAASIVEHAQQYNNVIQARPDAPQGIVRTIPDGWDHTIFAQSDLVLCRNTAPLIELVWKLIKARVPAFVKGKDIGAGLESLIKKMKAKGIDALIEKLAAYREREVTAATNANKLYKVGLINDKVDSILYLIDTLSENDRTVPALCDLIKTLFKDFGQGVQLSTIHKAKGLEAENVFWLNAGLCPSKYATQDWMMQQEQNLQYVAATRAKSTLSYIEQAKAD